MTRVLALALLLLLRSAPVAALALDVSWQPTLPRPGDAVLVTVAAPLDAAPTGSIGDRTLAFWRSATGWHAVTGLSVDLPAGPVPLVVEHAGGREERAVTVEAAAFRERELTVGQRFTQPSRAERRRQAADQKAFERAFKRPFTPSMVVGGFTMPREAPVTAPFGDKRMLNGKKSSQHYGIDLDGKTGAPVNAAADGRVVLVRDCFTSGRSVLVDHGAGTTSVYFHLHRVRVKQGQRVKKGQRLGDVGRTGRVTGPHLHFGVKIDGYYVDPERLLALVWPEPLPPPPAKPARRKQPAK